MKGKVAKLCFVKIHWYCLLWNPKKPSKLKGGKTFT